jgi:hypothetical protein
MQAVCWSAVDKRPHRRRESRSNSGAQCKSASLTNSDEASTRGSEGDCAQRTDFRRTAEAKPSRLGARHPRYADWAGRKRQSNTAAPTGAVEDGRRSMASEKNLVARGGRGPKGLDKKPIWLELIMGYSGRRARPGCGYC